MFFVYVGIPAMFSAYTMKEESWHDVAGIIWILIATLFFSQVQLIFALLGIMIGIGHLYVAIRKRKAPIIPP